MMRARPTSLLLATAWVAGIGCASKPAEAPSADAALDHACATSFTAPQAEDHDTDIDSILTQPTSDPRLAQINRRMYQSLRTLDAELRRERRLAACQQPSLESTALQAQANNQQDPPGGAAAGQSAGDSGVAGAAVGGVANATAVGALGMSAVAASSPPSSSSSAAGSGAAASGAAAAHATSIRKASLSNGRGGNGATAPKVVPGSDNDVVARRLRKAAEQETNPALRAKLWKEYTDYRQGTSTK